MARDERARRFRLRHGRRRMRVADQAPKQDALALSLWQAVESYLSERGKQQTIVAGYPWFADWGRDTFIPSPGLCLVTGRCEAVGQVIEAFSAHVSEGMVPNRFSDVGEQPGYNAIDASLWFIHSDKSWTGTGREHAMGFRWIKTVRLRETFPVCSSPAWMRKWEIGW